MATTVKKVLGTSTKYVLNFDSSPTVKELLDALKLIPTEDRDSGMKSVAGAGQILKSPSRFVFQVEAEQETDVPIV